MDASSPRWRQVSPSLFQWEADALEYVRAQLPDSDPVRAWANFEFVSGGSINEVDLLVTTKKGVFLVEIKSHPGRISGDSGVWVWHRPDGSRGTFDNPLFLANSKAKRLKGLLGANWPRDVGPRGGKGRATEVPFFKALVFLSDPDVVVDLPADLAAHVVVRDRPPPTGGAPTRTRFKGLMEAIRTIGPDEIADPRFRQMPTPQADALARAMERAGIKPSERSRKVGSHVLELPPISERGGTQDFLARHEQHGTRRRIRIFSNVLGQSPDMANALRDAATREFLAAERLQVDGVIRALDQIQTDFGPAVVYDHHPEAVRLDRFLAERGDELDLVARLRLVGRIAEILHVIHGRRLTHRMLTPQSIWLRPTRPEELEAVPAGRRLAWAPEISDLSMATREPGTVAAMSLLSGTGHLPTAAEGDLGRVLGDPAAEIYLAPEALTDPQADGQALDVFSVGVIAYLLCVGEPPAASRSEMRAALGTEGLRLSATDPDVDVALDELIREATCPVVGERVPRMADLVAAVELAVESLTATDEDGEDDDLDRDPLTAATGDLIGGRFLVEDQLGQGVSARALLCLDEASNDRVVLKVPLDGTSPERVEAEARALRGLRHPNVVELLDEVALGGRPTLVLAFAGRESLAVELRRHGPATPEFLERWGCDLLEALRHLDREGRSHRDVKPDNLGIVEQGKSRERHLVLFDFSLAGTPSSDTTAGTPGYLEPFLDDRDPPGWDQAAERYAAAVTLHELATGELPVWGDGRTNPAFTTGEVSLSADLLDPDLRAPLVAFFSRALRRDPAERFDTAEDMLRAWQRAFDALHAEPEVTTEPPRPPTDPGQVPTLLPEQLDLDDPVVSLGGSAVFRAALRRLGVEAVRDVAGLSPMVVNQARGIQVRTRSEVLRVRAELLTRFADAPLAEPPATEPAALPAVPPDLDSLTLRLIPPRGARGPKGAVAETVSALLGLPAPADAPAGAGTAAEVPTPGTSGGGATDDWPTVAAVADARGLSVAAVSRSLQKARDHWRSSPELMGVADDLTAILVELGGVAAVGELVGPLIEARGSGADADTARRIAGAVIRAVVEATDHLERDEAPRFLTRRNGSRMLVALDGEVPLGADDGPGGTSVGTGTFDAGDGSELAALAAALGGRADELVADAVLVPATDALPALRALPAEGVALGDGRLVRLAAASSQHAVANAAADLVARDATPEDVLRWSRATLVGAGTLTPDALAARVRARFPSVELPPRPDLDELLATAELPFRWDDDRGRYTVAGAEPGALSAFTTGPHRGGTLARRPTHLPAVAATAEELSPELAAALDVEEHLLRSLDDGGFVALRGPTNHLGLIRRNLARFGGAPHHVQSVDLEARFLAALRAEADRRRVAWERVLEADEAGSANAARLAALAGPAVDAVVDEVIAAGPAVVAWFPGVLLRHERPDGPGAIDRLREAATTRSGPLRTLWLVVLSPQVGTKPSVDGHPVPVIGSAEWVDLTDAWIENAHRARGLSA